jgi:5-deoxy-glucuronate isomerase
MRRSSNNGEELMKYHAFLPTNNGLNTPPINPCKLLEFGFLKLATGETYSADSGARELVGVLLGGRASFEVREKHFEIVGGRPNVFNGKPHSIYIPAKSKFTITADSPVKIALPSAPSDLEAEPYVIKPSRVANGGWGAANFKRYYHQILTTASQPELPARRLIIGETFTPSGNRSTNPPHKHQPDDLPRAR